MTNVIRLEGDSGNIAWLLPSKISTALDEASKINGEQWKKDALKEITDFLNKYVLFLLGTLLSPPEVMHQTLDDLNNFLNMESKISIARIENYRRKK